MFSLQTEITINNQVFHIRNKGDYRVVLDCFNALNDDEMSEDYRVLASLFIFYEELNDFSDIEKYTDILENLYKEMTKFFNCGDDKSPGRTTNTPLIDWEQDSQIICSAINNVAKTEIRALEHLHWWTFMGYYLSVGESVLSTVVSIRDKVHKGKKLDKWEQDFKASNPDYFTWRKDRVEEEKLLSAILGTYNGGE